MPTPKNHFDILGLKPGATEDEVKKAYRKLAKQWHPDKNKEPGAEDRFKEISTSYEYLSSQDRREILERDLKKKSEEPKSNSTYTFWSHNDFSFGASKPSSNKSKPSSTSQNNSNPSDAKSESKENTKPSNKKSHWSDTFTQKEKNKSRSKKKPMFDEPFVEDLYDDEDDFHFDYDYDREFQSNQKTNQKPNFSFAFQTFVDQLDNQFDSNFMGYTLNSNPFENGFGLGAFPFLSSGQPKPKPRKRDVAEETGYTGGLDEEYLFNSPRKQTSDNHDQTPGVKYQCNFCYKIFTPAKLIQHELKCGKWLEDEIDDDIEDNEDDDFNEPFPAYRKTPHQDWQDSHNDLINQVRRDKKMARMRAFHEREQIICKYCKMGFSKSLADRHILSCTKRFPKHAQNTQSPDGESKQQKSKEYSRRVPQPKGYPTSETPDNFDGRNEQTPRHGGSRKDTDQAPSKGETTGSFNPSSKFKHPDSGLGVNGERIGARKPGNGCVNCTQKYGKNAKFTCSCGTKKSGC